jgi:hypothetical protein
MKSGKIKKGKEIETVVSEPFIGYESAGVLNGIILILGGQFGY